MTGGQKPGSGGTDPTATGSEQQNAANSPGVSHSQTCDMTEKMDQPRKQDPATIDRWFDRQLNQLYSDVVSEPLPKEFLELIEQLSKKTPTK